MEYTFADLVDRLSIMYRKKRFGKEFDDEYNAVLKAIGQKIRKHKVKLTPHLIEAIITVAEANTDIWNREHTFRHGKELPVTEIAELAIAVRDFNGIRVAGKNELSKYTDEYKDVKVQHIAENRFKELVKQ